MRTYEPKAESPSDIAAQASHLRQAVIGQIQRLRGQSTKPVVEFAVDAWERIATKERVAELAAEMADEGSVIDVVARLRRDVLVYLNDCARIDRGAAQTTAAARELLSGAIDAVLRYA